MTSVSEVVWKMGAFHLKGGAQLGGVGQSAVVRQRHAALDVVDHQRLGVEAGVGAHGAVAHVRHGHLSRAQRVQGFGGEDVADQPRALVAVDDAVVVDGDAAALLAAMLQGVESIIAQRGDVQPIAAVNAEHAAFLMQFVIHTFPSLFAHQAAQDLVVSVLDVAEGRGGSGPCPAFRRWRCPRSGRCPGRSRPPARWCRPPDGQTPGLKSISSMPRSLR